MAQSKHKQILSELKKQLLENDSISSANPRTQSRTVASAPPRTVAASATGVAQRVGSSQSASRRTRFTRGMRYRASRGGRDGTVEGFSITFRKIRKGNS